MPVFYDQLGRAVNVPAIPQRIVSVVPSQTELLFALGLNDEVAGITKFCIRPEDKFRSTQKVGGTKQLDLAKIKSLKPDLILTNKEENERSQLEELMQHYPVWISDISDLDGALKMIGSVGEMVGRLQQSTEMIAAIQLKFDSLNLTGPALSAVYFIWRKPYMLAGKGTFIDSMLQKCGLVNAIGIERYPEIDEAALKELKPEVVLLSSEPYPFREKHLAAFKSMVPSAIVKLADGEPFSWYGSRLLNAPDYF